MSEPYALWALEYGRHEIEDALTRMCKQGGYLPSELAVIYDGGKDEFLVVEQDAAYQVLSDLGFDRNRVDAMRASEHPDRVLLVAAKVKEDGTATWSALRFEWSKNVPAIGVA